MHQGVFNLHGGPDMSSGNELVPMAAATAPIPIAQMRNLYRLGDV